MMPIGVPMHTPMMVIIRLPTMALRKPPSLPGAGLSWVKTAIESPPKPLKTRVPKMMASIVRPTTVAKKHSAIAIMLVRLRPPYRPISLIATAITQAPAFFSRRSSM